MEPFSTNAVAAFRQQSDLPDADKDQAVLLAALKLCNHISSDIRNGYAKTMPPEETVKMLGGLLIFLVDGFDDYTRMNVAIDRLALRSGFRIEEAQVSSAPDIKQ